MEAGLPDRLHHTPSTAPSGIVHLGLGAFFRAHGAIFVAEAMARSGGDWGITGVSLQSPGTRDKLKPQGWAYTASKHGVAGLTKLMANEWAAKGLTVNAIAPGYIETNNTEALRADPDRSKAILDRIPAGRWGRPEDIAQTAVFLAAPASDYINGAILNVDGGWLAR